MSETTFETTVAAFCLVVVAAGCNDAVRRQPVVRAAANPSSARAGEAVSLSGTVSNAGGKRCQLRLGADGRRPDGRVERRGYRHRHVYGARNRPEP